MSRIDVGARSRAASHRFTEPSLRPLVGFMLVAIVGLSMVLSEARVRAAADPASPTPADLRLQALLAAYRAIDAGQPEQAQRLIARILPPGGQIEFDPVVHAALIMNTHLEGRFNLRHQPWLNRQVLDMVVLVEDERQIPAAMEGWTDQVFWPILIDDGFFSTLFIRRFQPERIVRLPAAENLPEAREALEKAVAQHAERPRDADAPPPPGLVVIRPDSPQRMAGLALAVGRHQPIVLQQGNEGFTDILDQAKAVEYAQTFFGHLIREQVAAADSWVGLTLAGNFPYRYRNDDEQRQIHATADLWGRNPGLMRVAVAGHLMGDSAQSLYQAMSSMFLQPETVLAFDGYPGANSPLSQYRMDQALRLLPRQLRLTSVRDAAATVERLRELTRPSNPFDLVLVNSSGGSTQFNIRGRGRTADFPFGRASAFHVTHSFSAQSPHNPDSLAGRAIAGGAFWYYGSVNEPFLAAFVHPNQLLLYGRNGTPLSFAARRSTYQPLSSPWMLTVIGDPLYSLRAEPARRIKADVEQDDYVMSWPTAAGRSLSEQLKARAVLDPEQAWQTAVELLAQPRLREAPVLRLAALALIEAGREEQLLKLSDTAIRRDWLVRRGANLALKRAFDRQLPQDQLEAFETLGRMAMLHDHADDFRVVLDAWWAKMASNRETGEAVTALRDLRSRQGLPQSSQRMIDSLLP